MATAISNENIAFLAMIVFPALLFGGFLLQWLVKALRGSTQMALYELSRGPIETYDRIPDEDKLPGYDTLTKQDYDEIYEILKKEMLIQLAAAKNSGADDDDEYEDEDEE